MMKFALFAAVALLPFLAFAGDNRCETCGKDLFPAKYSRQCAACIVRESVTEFSDFVRYTDKDMPRVKAERRVRRLGSTAVWTLACYDHRFPIEFVDANGGSHRLDYRLILPVKDNPGRIRIILRDAVDTYIIGAEKGKLVKHRGVYVLDNLPICLPGRNQMILIVNRNAVDSIEYVLAADDGTARSPKVIRGTAKSGEITDFSSFY